MTARLCSVRAMPSMRPLLLCSAVLALVLAGCGGDDGGSGGGSAPTQQQFAQQANGICADLDKRSQTLAQELLQANVGPEAVAVVDRIEQTGRDAVRRLTELPRPEGSAGDLATRFVDASRRDAEQNGFAQLDRLRTALEQQDRQALQQAFRELGENEETESDRLARQLGAPACDSQNDS